MPRHFCILVSRRVLTLSRATTLWAILRVVGKLEAAVFKLDQSGPAAADVQNSAAVFPRDFLCLVADCTTFITCGREKVSLAFNKAKVRASSFQAVDQICCAMLLMQSLQGPALSSTGSASFNVPRFCAGDPSGIKSGAGPAAQHCA